MLVFSEGVPRSGKSYDAVKNHILPALKKGRRVYARLNGLHHERIAAYLKLPVERVRDLLVVVETADVVETFKATQEAGDGKWTIDPKFKNALVVIDEVHEFYVGGTREPIDPASEQFFALHGHYGMDVLTLTQFYKRVHTAIRFRIERKNTFQKLSALGKKGENTYRETAWQTVAPDKYEKVGGRTRSYDADIFPLYQGIVGGVDGDVTQEVYDGGRTSVWRGMALRAAIIVPLGLFGVWYLLDFFSGGGAKLVDQDAVRIGTAAPISAPVAAPPGGVWQQPVAGAAPVKEPTKAELARAAMTPAQVYVWDLSGKARIRFTGAASMGDRVMGWVEWIDSAGVAIDRLSLAQLRAMGLVVTVVDYGVELVAQGETIVATAWPLNLPVREEQPRLYRLDGTPAAMGIRASEASPDPIAAGGVGIGEPGAVQRYGGFRGEVGRAENYEVRGW